MFNLIEKIRFWDDFSMERDPNSVGLGFAIGIDEGVENDYARQHIAAVVIWDQAILFSFGRKNKVRNG